MNKKEKLELSFKELPGVGPRQAKRFVHSLLYKNKTFLNEMANLISHIKDDIKKCSECNRFFESINTKEDCYICCDISRDEEKILILEKNFDLENIESTNVWDGKYFLIGRNLKLTEKNPEEKIFLTPLISKIKNLKIKEITFGLSFNPEGENTKEYIKDIISPICFEKKIKITELGRGLSLGSEIEYSDSITLTDAFNNRK